MTPELAHALAELAGIAAQCMPWLTVAACVYALGNLFRQ